MADFLKQKDYKFAHKNSTQIYWQSMDIHNDLPVHGKLRNTQRKNVGKIQGTYVNVKRTYKEYP